MNKDMILVIIIVVILVALLRYVYNNSMLGFNKTVKKAENGDAKSQFILGMFFEQRKNYFKMEKYYKLSAENGYVKAQKRYGALLIFGDCIENNLEEGIEWLRKAADSGDIEALQFMVELNSRGDLIPSDDEKLFYWAKKLALKKEKFSIDFCIYYADKIQDREVLVQMVKLGLKAKSYNAYICIYNMWLHERRHNRAFRYLKKAAKYGSEQAKLTMERLTRYRELKNQQTTK